MASPAKSANKGKGKEKMERALETATARGIEIGMGSKKIKTEKQQAAASNKDVAKLRAKQKLKANVYLNSLLDPIGFGPASIPDLVPYPSTPFSLKQIVPITTSSTGEFTLICNPWPINLYSINQSSLPYIFQASASFNASQAAVIQQTFSSLRPVSGIVNVRFRGNITNTQGMVCGCLINPHETLPVNYTNFTQYAMSKELPMVDGLSVLWKPTDQFCDKYTDSNWQFLNSTVYESWDQPVAYNGGVPLPQVFHGLGFGPPNSGFSFNAWGFNDGSNNYIVDRQNTCPAILLAGSGLAESAPNLIEVEMVWNFEALLSQNTYSPAASASASTVDPAQYFQARKIMADVPTVAPVKAVEKKGFWDYAGPVIDKVSGRLVDAGLHFLGL